MTSHSAKRSVPFRSWFYFRTGYSEYFIYIFGVLNTLTLTFYLAMDNYPELGSLFPSFVSYVATVSIVGFPLLVLIGYLHMRRTSAYRSEVEIVTETHPYMYRLPPGIHQEVIAPFFYEMIGILKKADAGETLTPEEIENLKNLDKKLKFLMDGGVLKRPDDFGGL